MPLSPRQATRPSLLPPPPGRSCHSSTTSSPYHDQMTTVFSAMSSSIDHQIFKPTADTKSIQDCTYWSTVAKVITTLQNENNELTERITISNLLKIQIVPHALGPKRQPKILHFKIYPTCDHAAPVLYDSRRRWEKYPPYNANKMIKCFL